MNSIYKLALLFSLCWGSLPVSGQKKIGYAGSIETALLNGGYGSNAAIITTHGIKLNNWSASLGSGIDYYRFRSVPVFIDIKKILPIGKMQPFVQVSAGVDVAWPTPEQKLTPPVWSSWWGGSDTMSFSNGFYSKATAGIVLNPKGVVKISAVAGWSLKSLSARYYDQMWNGTAWVYEPVTSSYSMNRLYIGLSASF